VSGGGLLWTDIIMVLLVFNILNSVASRALFLPLSLSLSLSLTPHVSRRIRPPSRVGHPL